MFLNIKKNKFIRIVIDENKNIYLYLYIFIDNLFFIVNYLLVIKLYIKGLNKVFRLVVIYVIEKVLFFFGLLLVYKFLIIVCKFFL